MADDLLHLIPAGIDDERTRALVRLIGRQGDLDLTKLLIYRVDELQDDALHLLGWQFHVMGAEGWDLAGTPEERRALIKRAIELHRYTGTPWAIREAVKSLGYADAEIIEGLPVTLYDGERNHSGAESYGGGVRWAMFRVLLDLGEDKGVDATRIRQLVDLIEIWKNARSHLVDIGFRANTEDAIDVDDEMDARAVYVGEDVYPWGRLYDGSTDHDHGVRHLHDGAINHAGAADHTGWGETGELYNNKRVDLTSRVSMTIEDAMGILPLHDGRYAHDGITYGLNQPSVADQAMPIIVSRHVRHDGKYRHAGDLYDGEQRHGGARSHFTGIFHESPVITRLTAI